MKRILVEILLVLALAGAGAFGWINFQKGKAVAGKMTDIEVKAAVAEELLKDAEKELETADDEMDALRDELEPLQIKSLELDAVKAALANGPILEDLEGLYKKQKGMSVERQLGLGALRMLIKGSDDPGATEAFKKALQMADWGSRKNSICAAQIGLAAAGEKVKVMSECAIQPPNKTEADSSKNHGDSNAKDDGHGASKAGDKHAAAHWGYEGEMGPEKWGNEFPTCGKGKSQSPLNIKGPFVKARFNVTTDYKAGPLKIINNGHTIQVNVPSGSKIRIDGMPYELIQFHFHRPSEEQIDGKPQAMVIHLVHKNEAGKLAVLGVLLKEGNENPGIKTLWANLPTSEGQEVAPSEVSFNPSNLLPREFDFYNYDGSLTTPPCTEGVRFFILKSTVNISREQVNDFPFKNNARPVQELNGRTIMSN